MAKHTRIRTNEQRERLLLNRETLLSVIDGSAIARSVAQPQGGMTITLERILTKRSSGDSVPFEGDTGIERLLSELTETYQGGRLVIDDHLVGISGTLVIEGQDAPIDLRATLGSGGQVRLRVGPSSSPLRLLDAIRVFDRHVHLACKRLGLSYELTAQGYNPSVASPSDVVPLPLSSQALLNTYLSHTGRYARDAMRCTASTRISLPLDAHEQDAVTSYRIFAALSPVIAFLTDNSLRLRGSGPRQTPRMARSLVWSQVDPTRCGLVPGTFAPGFGFAAYESWVEGVCPILFVSDDHLTFSTGSNTCARVMEERDLSVSEARRLLRTIMPDVRWNGRLEICCADSLPPRLAVAYALLAKGVSGSAAERESVCKLLNMDEMSDDAVERAWHDLRELGWAARVYGRPITQIANELASIASRGLEDRDERRALDTLSQMWEVHSVPRDILLDKWERTHVPSKDEEAIELYGEGAVIPYEQLAGDPPAGQTAVMRFKR
ncbi:MAG: hypothetical protein J6D34_08810 [Atopobiaceae bacterium]|nr:hypothetical protein [Atopobiaceae bacterium]